jgi:hypothetical protein
VVAWPSGCHLQSSDVEASMQGVLTKLEHTNATIMELTTSMQGTYESLTTASNDMVNMLQLKQPGLPAAVCARCSMRLPGPANATLLSCMLCNTLHCNSWTGTAVRRLSTVAACTVLRYVLGSTAVLEAFKPNKQHQLLLVLLCCRWVSPAPWPACHHMRQPWLPLRQICQPTPHSLI